MQSGKSRFLALILATAVGAGTMACDSSEEKPEGAETAESVEALEGAEEEAPKEAASEIDLEKLPFYAKGPVATVDGAEVPADRFNEITERRASQMPGAVPPQMIQVYKKQTMDMVIDEFLIERKIKSENVDVSAEEVDKAYNEFLERFQGDEAQLANFLKQNRVTEAVIREDIGKDVALRKIVAKTHNLDVDPAEVTKLYEENKARFQEEDQVRASHILLTVEPGADEAAQAKIEARAKELHKLATAAGADFAELAREHSSCPSAPQGGDLNFFAANRMVPEFSKAAFAMKTGDISEPVKTQFGYHIIKVTDKKEARTVPFEEVREGLEMQLTHNVMREAITKFLADIKEESKIERLEDNIVVKVSAQAPTGLPQGIDPSQFQQLKLNNPQLGGGGSTKPGHEGHDHD